MPAPCWRRSWADGESSRLYQALVYQRQIALSAAASFETHLNPGLFEIAVEMKPGHSAAEGLAAVDSVLAALREQGPDDRELTKARNQLEAGFIRSLETNNGAAEKLGFYEHLYGDYRAMFGVLDRYRALTATDCRRDAAQVFDPARRTIAVLVPLAEGGEAAAMSARTRIVAPRCCGAARAREPRAGARTARAAASHVLPPVTRARLKNGLTVLIVPSIGCRS